MSHINKGDVHAYLDGALGAYPEEAAQHVREHLDACRECAHLLESERRLRQEASTILAASAQGPVELDPLEELLARAAEPDRREGAERAEGSETEERVRPLVGRRLYSLRWAATVVISLGAGWMAREVIGPAASVARGPTAEPIVAEIDLQPAADQERLERDNVGGFAEAETLRESQAGAADGRAETPPPESRIREFRTLAPTETPPEAPSAVVVGGGVSGTNRGAGAFDDDVVLDQVEPVPARERAEVAAIRGVVAADARVSAQTTEPPLVAARVSDELRASALSDSAPDSDRQDGPRQFRNVGPVPSASALSSTTPFLVPGLPVRDVRLAPQAEDPAGRPSGSVVVRSVVVTQELEDGRTIELQFIPSPGSDEVLKEALQERNDPLGRRTQQAGWATVVRDVPGGVAVLSGPLTPPELEDLLDRAFGPR